MSEETETRRSPGRAFLIGGLVVGGLLFHLILFLGVQAPLAEREEPEPQLPFAAYSEGTASTSASWREKALLLDSQPLFMPTQWNSASDLQEIARLRDETELFRPYAPVVRLGAEAPPALVQESGVNTDLTASTGASERFHPLTMFGRSDRPPTEPLAARAAQLEWVRLDGRSSGVVELEAGSLGASPGELWAPAEFWVVVDTRVGRTPPQRLSSSGDAGWDVVLRDYLGSDRFVRTLEPGYYRS